MLFTTLCIEQNSRNCLFKFDSIAASIVASLILLTASVAAAAESDGELNGERQVTLNNAESNAEKIQTTITEGYATPELVGTSREQTHDSTKQPNTKHQVYEAEIWVADISTYLNDDSDHDGYFAGFTVSMDIDVEYDYADVFAEIYLQPYNAAPQLLYVTQVFSIYERASADRYDVDVGLLDNTPAGEYNLLIDVVDAYSGRVVDTVSNFTHYNLMNLPLESSDYQNPYDDDFGVQTSLGVQILGGSSPNNGIQTGIGFEFGFSTTSNAHGGSTSWLALFGLALVAGLRRFCTRRRHSF